MFVRKKEYLQLVYDIVCSSVQQASTLSRTFSIHHFSMQGTAAAFQSLAAGKSVYDNFENILHV